MSINKNVKSNVKNNVKNKSNVKGFLLCDIKKKLLIAVNSMDDIRKIMLFNNKIAKIVLEETIAENWIELKKMIKQIYNIIPYLKKAVIWNIEDMQNFIVFFENNLKFSEISPCNFAIFLEELLKKKQTEQDINFFKYILSNDTICKRVFRT
jgi:hypothetical protein